MKARKLYLAADHAGFPLKEKLKKYLGQKGIVVRDLGTHSRRPVDYPDYARVLAEKVAKTKNSQGILICGTGIGMAIAANKVKGIRAALAYDKRSARLSRTDNHANVLALGGRFFSFEKAKEIVAVWLKTPFGSQSRHKKRVAKIKKIESR